MIEKDIRSIMTDMNSMSVVGNGNSWNSSLTTTTWSALENQNKNIDNMNVGYDMNNNTRK